MNDHVLCFPPFCSVFWQNTDKSTLHVSRDAPPSPRPLLMPAFLDLPGNVIQAYNDFWVKGPHLPDHYVQACLKLAQLLPPIVFDPVVATRVADEWRTAAEFFALL